MEQFPDAISFFHQIVKTIMSVTAHVKFDVLSDNNGVSFNNRFVAVEGDNRAAHQMFSPNI
ncbi:hypothetical protein D3C87_1944900 [compost metagenome]